MCTSGPRVADGADGIRTHDPLVAKVTPSLRSRGSFPRARFVRSPTARATRFICLREGVDAGPIQPLGREVSRAILLDVAAELEKTLVDRSDEVLDATSRSSEGSAGVSRSWRQENPITRAQTRAKRRSSCIVDSRVGDCTRMLERASEA